PTMPTTIFAAGRNGIHKSTDGGASWNAVNNGLENQDGQFYATALAIDPTNSNIIYTAGPDIDSGGTFKAIYKSTDGGGSWSASNDGLQVDPNDENFWGVSALAIDPGNPGIVLAGATFDGVFKRSNGGRWSAFNVGLTNLTTNALAVDPSNPNIVYTGTDG